ncbi:MAG: hypothetical protein FWE04_01540 [Oscillospiraceae bacterium]|nr:hypothetical protein [Oscillospiraceae bacterium]
MKRTNLQFEMMIAAMRPILPHRDKVGYICARNVRIITNALEDYFKFRDALINELGETDNESNVKFINPDSPNWEKFEEQMRPISEVEQEIPIITMLYSEVIGLLNGEEILNLEFMLTDGEATDNG